MKKLTYLAACGALLCAAFQSYGKGAPAQGTIVYDMNIALRQQVAKENAMVASFVPEQQHITITLTYKGGNYAIEQKTIPSKGSLASQAVTNVITDALTAKELVNTKNSQVRGEYIFKKKNFYTETAMKPLTGVTYTNETRVILGYTCYKAVITGKKERKIVWYTRDFLANYTPDTELAGIKGTILEYSGAFYTARAVSVTPAFNAATLIAKTPAKKITEEQLQDLQEDMMESSNQAFQPPAGSNGKKPDVQTHTIIIGK